MHYAIPPARAIPLLLLLFPACDRPGPERLRVLAVGESTTADASGESWTALAERELRPVCPGLELHRFAVSGADSSDLAARMPAGLSIYRPHLVITMIGANDRGEISDLTEEDRRLFGAPHSGFAEMQSALLQHILERDPLDDRRFVFRFLRPYLDQGMEAEALAALKAVLLRHPRHTAALLQLAELERARGNEARARELRGQALRLAGEQAAERPQKRPALLAALLSELRAASGSRRATRAAYARARAGFPKAPEPHLVAAGNFRGLGAAQEEERALRRVLEFAPGNRVAGILLRELQRRRGQRLGGPEPPAFRRPPRSRENYLRIAALIERSGARHFAMEYPGRGAAELRDLFSGRAVTVISNEEGFQAARDPLRFPEFFLDRFAGDLGHFRPRAHGLVAAAVTRALQAALRESGLCGGTK